MGKGGSTSNTSTYSPPPEVSAAYKGLISGAERLLYPNAKVNEDGSVDTSTGSMASMPQYTPEAQREAMSNISGLVAPFSQNMTSAGNTIAGLAGYAQPYVNAGTGLALAGASPIQLQQFSPNAINQYMSPYLSNVMGSTVANINETNAQQQQQLLGNLIQKGAFGGDRAGIAQSELARQQGLANNATLANIANAGYGQALGEFNTQQALDAQRQLQSGQLALSAAPLLANLGGYGQSAALQQAQAQYGYGTAEQQQQQAGLSTGYQQFLNKNAYPYQQLGWLGGLVSGAASGMGGTTTSSIPQPSTANQIIGGLGALGSMGGLGNLFGGAGGAGAGFGSFLSGIGSAVGSAASGIGEGLSSLASLVFLKDGGSVRDMGAPAFAEGGSVGSYATGGPTQEELMKASPITGLSATNPFPTLNMAANPHMPQTPNTKPESLDTSKLKDAVQGIKSLMGKPEGGVAGAANAAPFKTPDQMSPDMQNMPLPPSIPMEAHGGLVGHYYNGGIVIPHGMQTKEDMKNLSEDIAGSGVAGVPSSTYALASEDLLGGKEAYRGGVIMKDDGGPVEGVAAAPANTYGIPANLYPHYVEASKETGVPIQLLAAKDKQESRFSNEATGKAGEVGITQVLPSTARNPGYGMEGVDPQALRDPRENIMFGARYLAARGNSAGVKDWNDPNQAAQALRAYNGGGDPNYVQNVFSHMPGGAAINAAMRGSGAPQGIPEKVQQTPGTVDAQRIPFQSQATKEGLFGALGIAMTPEQRLASFQAFAKLAGTPGKFGVGLAAAADTYAKTLLEAQGQTRQTALGQAQAERERAGAEESRTKALTGQFQPGPAGFARFAPGAKEGEVQITAVDMPDFGKTATIGPGGTQTQTAANATEGGAGTPSAPASPSAAAPKVEDLNFASLAGNQTPEEKIKIMQDAANGLRGQAWGTQAPENMKIYNEQNTQAQAEAQAASGNRTNVAALTRAVTDTPTSGWQARGAGKELRDQIANYLNTGYGMATGQSLGATADNLSSEQVIGKIGTLSTQGMQKGLGREAGFWLNTLKSAFPGGAMSEGAAKEILAQMIVEPRQAMDRATVYDQYGKMTKNMGKDVVQVFNKINPPDQYVRDKQHIKDILLDKNSVVGANGKKENLITALQNGGISRQEFDALVSKKYGVQNLSRYFIGG